MMRPNLYIDMDGVIISMSAERHHPYPQLVPDAMEFLEWAVTKFHCYYLTCWTLDDLKRYDHLRCLPRFPFMDWTRKLSGRNYRGCNKVSGIDIKSDFYWLEDGIVDIEHKELEELGLHDRYFFIDPCDDYALTKWKEWYENPVRDRSAWPCDPIRKDIENS